MSIQKLKMKKLPLIMRNNKKTILMYETLVGEGVHSKDEESRTRLQWMWQFIVQFIVVLNQCAGAQWCAARYLQVRCKIVK